MEETTTATVCHQLEEEKRYENINGDDITRAKAKVAQLKADGTGPGMQTKP